MKVILQTDGASRGNPGPASAGVVIRNLRGEILGERSERLGDITNNEAEYRALILGLGDALKLGASELDLRLDSELLVRQLQGTYKVRAANLIPLNQAAHRFLKRFKHYTIQHVPREMNRRADQLANRALDRKEE